MAEDGRAATIDLQLNSFPTEQGWRYQGISEPNAVGADGTSLIINTIGFGAVSAWYQLSDSVVADLPFALVFRARLISDTSDTNVISLQVQHGFEKWGIQLRVDTIVTPNLRSIPIAGTEFHNIVIEGKPGEQSKFYIDGVLIENTIPYVTNIQSNPIAFGDGNAVPGSATNTYIEWVPATSSNPDIPPLEEETISYQYYTDLDGAFYTSPDYISPGGHDYSFDIHSGDVDWEIWVGVLPMYKGSYVDTKADFGRIDCPY